MCACALKSVTTPPPLSLSLARYLGIRTARKWQSTVKEQVLLGLRCVTEQTLPHQTGCLFCTLPLSSVTHYPNHIQSRHLVIWSSERGSLSAVMACGCVFSRLAAHPVWSCLVFFSSPLLIPFFSQSVISRTHGELSRGKEGIGGMRNH